MYVEYHKHYSNEVYQATACYVIWKNLHNEPAKDKKLLGALNVNALSWICIRNSMMVSLIMALGRIFDTDGDAVSIDDFIKSCISDIDLFSKANLRTRKLEGRETNSWIDSYIEKSYEPNENDFQRLRPQIKIYRDQYEKYYKPLRHKVFAHSDKLFYADTDELWIATKDANLEEILNFLEDLNISIREAYLNGRKPELQGRTINEEWFGNDICSLLDRVKNASKGSPDKV